MKTNKIQVKLSIIISMYNISNWITECINSLKNISTREDVEVLIINDGSTDDSLKRAKESIEDTKIKIITKKNGGLASARNFGLEKSIGKYIWFVDGDDMIMDKKIDKLMLILDKDFDLIHFKIEKIDDQTKKITPDFGWKNKNNISEIEDKKFLKKNGLEFSPWSKIYRRSLFDNIHWPNIIYEDVFFVSKQLMENKSIYFLNEIFYIYRINRENSILNNANDSEKNKVHIRKLFEFIENIDVNDSYFIAGMYLLTAKMHDLPKDIMIFYKKNLKYVLKTEQYKNYFKRSIIYKIARLVISLRLFFILKIVLRNKKISQ